MSFVELVLLTLSVAVICFSICFIVNAIRTQKGN
jgi:hypothetical protein